MEKLLEQILQKLDCMQTQMNDMQTQINDMQDQMDNRFEKVEREIAEISQRQFVFEETYGRKIDAIFDSVTMQMQRNLKHSEQIQELTERMDKNDITMLDYDRRMTNLALKR